MQFPGRFSVKRLLATELTKDDLTNAITYLWSNVEPRFDSPRARQSFFKRFAGTKLMQDDQGKLHLTGPDGRRIVDRTTAEQIIMNRYKTNPLNSRDQNFEQIGREFIGVTQRLVMSTLKEHETYQLHRIPPRVEMISLPQLPKRIGWLSMDLIDIKKYRGHNQGYQYILHAVDCLSKFAWAVPLRNKSADETARGLKIILDDNQAKGINVWKVSLDQGKEWGAAYYALLRENDIAISFSIAHRPTANSIIESANRWLMSRLFAQNTQFGNLKFVERLAKTVEEMNERRHSITNSVPAKLHPKGALPVQTPEEERASQQIVDRAKKLINKANRWIPEMNVGDYVRIRLERIDKDIARNQAFRKGYLKRWTTEVFRIYRIKQPDPLLANIRGAEVYYVSTLAGKKLRLRLLAKDLQPVVYPYIPSAPRVKAPKLVERAERAELDRIEDAPLDSSDEDRIEEPLAVARGRRQGIARPARFRDESMEANSDSDEESPPPAVRRSGRNIRRPSRFDSADSDDE